MKGKNTKTSDISVLPYCLAFWLHFLSTVSGTLKRSIVQNPENPKARTMDGLLRKKRNWVEKMLSDNINEILVSNG